MRLENSPTLESDRLRLRKFNNLDIPAMYQLYSNPKVMHFIPRFPFTSLDQTAKHLHQVIFPYYTKALGYYYAIELKTSKEWLGYLAIGNVSESNDLGYALRQEFWYNNYAFEAAQCLITHLKQVQTLSFITATHDILNPNSGKIMQKLAMRYQYSYKELWLPKNYLVTFRLYQYNFKKDAAQYQGYAIKYDYFLESLSVATALAPDSSAPSAAHQKHPSQEINSLPTDQQ